MKSKTFQAFDRSLALLTSFVYFVQGGVGLAAIAFPLFLRQRGWSISQIATFSFLSNLPWALKIFYGALSDGVPLGALRRKPYILIASLLSSLSWLGLAFFSSGTSLIYAWALVGNFGFAMTDVVTDALIVEKSSESTTQAYQSLAWGFRSFGAVLAGVSGGWLAQRFPFPFVFALTALLPLTTFAAGFLVQEEPQTKERGRGEGISKIWRPLREALRVLFSGDFKWFSLLLLATSFSASFSTPFFFFLKERLQFSETFLGLLSSLSWAGAIGGCLIYGKLMRRLSIRQALQLGVGLNAINILATYGVTQATNATLLSLLGGVLGYLTLLPLMATAALLSRGKGNEGTLFALIMSVYNLGQMGSTFIGGKLFDIMGVKWLIFLSAAVGLSGLVFIRRLRTIGRE